jgi:hypothetical protein
MNLSHGFVDENRTLVGSGTGLENKFNQENM